MKNLTLVLIALAVVSLVFSKPVISDEMPEINQKVDKLIAGSSNLEDVIRVFGEPTRYLWGRKTFEKEDLPPVFIAAYPKDISLVITDGTVGEIRFEGPRSGYLFMGKIGIGSRLEEVLDVVGQPRETIVNDPIGFKDGVLYKDIEGRKGFCYYARADRKVRMFFANYKVATLYLTRGDPDTGPGLSFQTVKRITSVKNFDDVRFKDMSRLDLSQRGDLIETLTFNLKTVWPSAQKLPPGRRPQLVLKEAMNPGLGIRQIHRQGITGKGVSVAIIDQPLFQDHPEFKGKVIQYYDTGCGSEPSMHGPAVASLLVGASCGTAPGARLYYAAAPSWLHDSAFYAKALEWIIERNAELTKSDKIRVVSVSAAPSGPGSPFKKNTPLWEQARSRALKEGILVLDCTTDYGFITSCWYDVNEPESVAKCTPGFPGMTGRYRREKLLAPCSVRTTAEHYVKGEYGYQYTGRGGLSWGIPYAAGVLALGWQIDPDLTAQQAKQLLFESAYLTADGGRIIYPSKFVELVKSTKAKKSSSYPETTGE